MSKTVTASVTPTAVQIHVLEKLVFQAGISIMDMDFIPTNTIKNIFLIENIICLLIRYRLTLTYQMILVVTWTRQSVYYVLSNYHPEVRRGISGSSSVGQGLCYRIIAVRWDQRVSRWPRSHDKYVCYQSQDIGGERIIR